MRIIAINPGSTSTKVAIWDDGVIRKENLQWKNPEMPMLDQSDLRRTQIEDWLNSEGVLLQSLSGIVARGGLLKPISSGTYEIDQAMVQDAVESKRGVHPSNLGPIIGHKFAETLGIPGFIVDPVSVDEVSVESKLTGCPQITRDSFGHVLSIRAASRRASQDLGIDFSKSRFVVAHIGGGTSVASVIGGQIVDINNANDEGPFSAERAGGLPFGGVLGLCYEPSATRESVKRLVLKNSGLQGYLGTMDLREVEKLTDEKSQLIYEAMIYQIAKEIGAYATVLSGKIDAIVLTGGMVHSQKLVSTLLAYISFLGPVLQYPGEEEMEALLQGAVRVLTGDEKAKQYGEGKQ